MPVFPVRFEHSATVMCLWKAWQCLLSPSGSPRSWGRTGQGPGHPHSSPEHSLRRMRVDPCRPVVGRRWERPPPGAEGGQAPTARAWWLLVADHPAGHGAGWEQLPLPPRRGWWCAGPAEGPPLLRGPRAQLLSPARAPPRGLGRWGGAASPCWTRWCPGCVGLWG